jgi:hypothetical protein
VCGIVPATGSAQYEEDAHIKTEISEAAVAAEYQGPAGRFDPPLVILASLPAAAARRNARPLAGVGVQPQYAGAAFSFEWNLLPQAALDFHCR